MKVSQQPLSLETLDTLTEADSICLFIAEDERPLQGLAGYLDWRLCGSLSRLLSTGFFVGAAGESLLLPTDGRVAPGRVFAIGLGRSGALTASSLAEMLGKAGDVLAKAKVSAVALEIPGGPQVDEAARSAALEQVFLIRFQGERVVLLVERQHNAPHPGLTDRRPR